MFITSLQFYPTTLLKLNSTMHIFPRSFTNLGRADFVISCPYLLLRTAVVKCLGKLPKILWRIATFILIRFFPFEFCKIFIKSRFSEHFHGFAFAMTSCQLKERVGKKKKLIQKPVNCNALQIK